MNWFTSPPLSRRPEPNPVLLAFTTCSGALGMHVMVPALPIIAHELGTSAGHIQLAITLYIVGMALGQLVYGPLSDRFGRRPLLLIGLTLYALSMLIGALAPTADLLIAIRVSQALGGCGGLVLGRAMIRDTSEPDQAAAKLALLNLAMSIAPAVAPAIGGYLTVWFGWRSIFWFLFALGAAVLVASVLLLPETNRTRTSLVGIGGMVRNYARLLQQRQFYTYAIGGACSTTSIYAFFSASPFLLIDVLKQPAEQTGLYYLLLVGGVSFGSLLANRLASRISINRASRLANGVQIACSGAMLLADVTGNLSVFTLIGPMVVYGAATGVAGPNTISGAISADPAMIGSASGLYGFLQFCFAAICTLIVSLWHDNSALPVAVVLVASNIAGQVALSIAGRK